MGYLPDVILLALATPVLNGCRFPGTILEMLSTDRASSLRAFESVPLPR
jgi:hypothetical protein